MVMEAIIDGAETFALWIIGLLPNLGSLTISDSVSGFLEVVAYGFWLIPMNVFVTCFGIILVVQNSDFVIAGITWLLRRIPGQG